MIDETKIIELLQKENTVVFGSMALDITTHLSDVDIAVHAKDVEGLFDDLQTCTTYYEDKPELDDPSPLLQKGNLYKIREFDIFVFKNSSELEAIRATMIDMRKYPKFILKLKPLRIKIFRVLLNKHNF